MLNTINIFVMIYEIKTILKNAIQNGYIKTKFDVDSLKAITNISNKKIQWKIELNSGEIFYLYSNRSKKPIDTLFKAEFYCAKCKKFIGEFHILTYAFNQDKGTIIPLDTLWGDKPLKKVCKHCFRSLLTLSCRDKIERTCQERYGCTNIFSSDKVRNQLKISIENLTKEEYKKRFENYKTYFLENSKLNVLHAGYNKLTQDKKFEELQSLLSNLKDCFNYKELFLKEVKNAIDIGYISCSEDLSIIQGIYAINENKHIKWYIKIFDKLFRIKSAYFGFKIFCKQYCKICKKCISEKCDLFELFFSKKSDKLKTIKDKRFGPGKFCQRCKGLVDIEKRKEKAKQTCFKKYGYEYAGQSPQIKQKILDTIIERYGGYGTAEWKQCFKTSGYIIHNGKLIHNGNIPEIREQMIKTRRITLDKMPQEIKEEWMKKIIPHVKSKIEDEFFDLLIEKSSNNIERQFILGKYIIDGLIENKIIIEFYGDYYHANPSIYEKDQIIKLHKKQILVSNIWKKDKFRLKTIQDLLKIPAIIIWEKSFRNNKEETIKKVLNLIDNILKENNGKSVYTI